MTDDQQSGSPPAGAPGPNPQQPPGAPAGWGAPQAPQWGAPQAPQWGAPQAPQWGAPQAPQWGAPQAPQWGAPQAPQWGAPQAPQWGAPQPGMPAPYGMPQPGFPSPYGVTAGYGYPPRYAGFWIRLVALFIDTVIWFFACLVAYLSILLLIGLILFPLVFFGYWPFFWWKRGASPGMEVLGLRVVREIDGGPITGGMAAIRGLVWWLEHLLGWMLLIGFVGFCWAAWEPRKRAVHDMAAGTVVIQTN